jgi:23S rRNA (cytosine1962-C5)-methyltransferase
MIKNKTNYELIDCGDMEKLEKIGDYLIRRPSPQATWKQKIDKEIWNNYQARYDKNNNKWINNDNSDLPDFTFLNLKFKLKHSPNRQIGIFPEQIENWYWLNQFLNTTKKKLNILNGFAYTGAASIVAAGAANHIHQITHLDAAATSVKWAKENHKQNFYSDNIRWIVDDIITFCKRELKRGNRYDGFILDPPAFGRAKKNTWKITRDLPILLDYVNKLLSDDPQFIILSSHDKAFSSEIMAKLVIKHCNLPKGKVEKYPLIIPSKYGNYLPSGDCVKWTTSLK